MPTSFRVLVVEDFEPFRRFVRSALTQRPEFQIVGEVSDGEDAVWRAEELQPDLVLLDLGLPTISGLETARRIRKLAPYAKILFVSIESSVSIVRECFRVGGLGYVHKMSARSDLLPAIDDVLRGIRFVSNGLELFDSEADVVPYHHELLFCSEDAVFLDAISRFAASAIAAHDAVIVLVTEVHRNGLERLLKQSLDVDKAIQQRTYVPWDVQGALSTFMVNGWPDPLRFWRAVGDLFTSVAKGSREAPRRVVACGECAPTLWAQGKRDAAIQVEQLWSAASRRNRVDTLCAYPALQCPQNDQAFKRLCEAHTTVYSR